MNGLETAESTEGQSEPSSGRPISCDQVAWMLDAIGRYLPSDKHPRVSRAREMQKYGLLYELMEVANLKFEDDLARRNGTPSDANPPTSAFNCNMMWGAEE